MGRNIVSMREQMVFQSYGQRDNSETAVFVLALSSFWRKNSK